LLVKKVLLTKRINTEIEFHPPLCGEIGTTKLKNIKHNSKQFKLRNMVGSDTKTIE
jgi:hypothetical protein